MAIDLITERISSLSQSPRISFSHDNVLGSKPNHLHRSDSSLVDSNPDFDFCISNSAEIETCSADELFFDGLIRPLQLQERFIVPKNLSLPKHYPNQASLVPPLPLPRAIKTSEKNNLKKENIPKNTESEEKQQPNQSKSFWSIKRSCSLHCSSSHQKSSFWSLPLLSRSSSTGSIPKALKESKKQSPNSNKNPKRLTGSSAPAASSVYFYGYPLSHKQPSVRKSYRGSNSNGVRICPVIYISPPCSIKGTINLFGFGSLFRNAKDKKVKK